MLTFPKIASIFSFKLQLHCSVFKQVWTPFNMAVVKCNLKYVVVNRDVTKFEFEFDDI